MRHRAGARAVLICAGAVVFGSQLGGCAWLAAHVTQVAIVGAVAGAVSQVEGVAVNAITLEEKVKERAQQQ